jgi:hypothetical protein
MIEKTDSSRRRLGAGAVLVLLGLLAHSTALAAPKLAVPKTDVEVGNLTSGESAEGTFTLENQGSDPLVISNVGTSCGCTTTSYPKTLAPGETGVLKATLASNPHWSGRVQKEITVNSNDPERPLLTLHLAADMRPLFQISPNPVIVKYKQGDVIRQVITIKPSSDKEPVVRVLGVASATPEAEARLLPDTAGSGPSARAPGASATARRTVRCQVEVTVRPPKDAGDMAACVTLKTSHPKVQTVPLVISLLAQDAITAQPPAIYWVVPVSGHAREATRRVTLVKRSGEFGILSLQTEHPGLQAEIDPDAPGQWGGSFHEITLRYVGGLPKGTTRGKLSITTTDPGSPRLEIPYQLTVP